MKKRLYIILSLICVITFVYLNRSYAHIYNTIKESTLTQPLDFKNYTIGESAKSLTYVVLGDSLTVGVGVDSYIQSYPYQIAEQISKEKNQQVILKPFAIPGAQTITVIDSLLDQAIQAKPDIVTILLGVNDIHGQISQDEFYKNYKIILERLKKETDAQIFVISIPYIGTSRLILPPYDLYFSLQTQKFNAILTDLTKEYSVPLIDLYGGYTQYAKDVAYYSSDLFHPNAKGYTLWADIIYANFNK